MSINAHEKMVPQGTSESEIPAPRDLRREIADVTTHAVMIAMCLRPHTTDQTAHRLEMLIENGLDFIWQEGLRDGSLTITMNGERQQPEIMAKSE